MKKLLSIIIVIYVSCKQPKNITDSKEIQQQSNGITIDKEKIQKFQKETIEIFLEKLKQAIREKNDVVIEKSIKFPFEHKIGGEADIYNTYQELNQGCPEFLKILEAKFITKENNIYSTLYPENIQNKKIFYSIRFSDLKNVNYFISYYAIQEGNSFKLVCLATPP